jgi:hypothetical protein
LNERIPAGQHRGAPPSETKAKVRLTTVRQAWGPRLLNVCEAERMCASSPTPQGKGNEMACQGAAKVPRVGKMYCHQGLLRVWARCTVRVTPAPRCKVSTKACVHTAAPTLWMCDATGPLKGLASSQTCQDTHTRCISLFLIANFGSFLVKSDAGNHFFLWVPKSTTSSSEFWIGLSASLSTNPLGLPTLGPFRFG